MADHVENSRAATPSARPTTSRQHPTILRVSSIGVAAILSALLVTGVAPPLVADQSDRAVVNAPVILLTAPIDGDLARLDATPGHEVRGDDRLATIVNPRIDRGTLISLEDKAADARQRLEAVRSRRSADLTYLAELDGEIAELVAQLRTQFTAQIDELRARVAQSEAQSGEKKALVERQTSLVERNSASTDMLRPTTQQYAAAQANIAAEKAKLTQKQAQLKALDSGVYAGDDLVTLNTMAQKRRDMDLDAKNMAIEEKELTSVLAEREGLMATERQRIDRLASAEVRAPGIGTVLSTGAVPGRHVNAGDTIASMVNCDKRFVVAIFSYRQGQTMAVGTRVRIEGAYSRRGVVTAVLPKTSDKEDERFAVPFPQTERRELYAIITPDKDEATPASDGNASTACTVGQWVTVTRDNAIVPSMSVTWRRLEQLVAGPGGRGGGSGPTAQQQATPAAATVDSTDAARRDATAKLAAQLRETAPTPEPVRDLADGDDWLAHRQSLVSR